MASISVLDGGYIEFINGDKVLISKAEDSLIGIEKVVDFDQDCGLITFNGIFRTHEKPVEDYLDLKAVLYALRIYDGKEYYSGIKGDDICVKKH